MSDPHTLLVRCSREIVERLIADDSEPVVVVRIEEHDDGTCEIVFRTPDEATR